MFILHLVMNVSGAVSHFQSACDLQKLLNNNTVVSDFKILFTICRIKPGDKANKLAKSGRMSY